MLNLQLKDTLEARVPLARIEERWNMRETNASDELSVYEIALLSGKLRFFGWSFIEDVRITTSLSVSKDELARGKVTVLLEDSIVFSIW